jgi:hypothetical protein
MITLTMAKALNAGMRRALEADPKVVIAGEDVGKLGGVFRVTEGLQKDFGEHRVIDSPLAESGIVGTAVGMALRGYRPVCEIQFDGFVYPAFDQIVSQLARLHYRSRRRVLDDPAGHCLRRPDHLLRTQAALSRTGGVGRVTGSGAVALRAGGSTRNRCHVDRVRTNGQDLPGRG